MKACSIELCSLGERRMGDEWTDRTIYIPGGVKLNMILSIPSLGTKF